ncbi:MAG: hypothetical protein JW768_15665 [Chitinispirillaceae bacterium]|nr:hypothetical protein [Chitinispirillaceae bacterium]
MGLFTDLIARHPELAGVRDELSLVEQKYNALEDENKKLREELSLLNASQEKKKFIEAAGVLWKRTPAGGHEPVPYCPTCMSMLADYSGSMLCLKCNWQAPLKSFEVPKVYHDLFGNK